MDAHIKGFAYTQIAGVLSHQSRWHMFLDDFAGFILASIVNKNHLGRWQTLLLQSFNTRWQKFGPV
jgi:hypothetical protein